MIEEVGVRDKDVGDVWKWPRPDVNTYTLLVRGLAASLRVSDALTIIANVCRVGVSPGEEVHPPTTAVTSLSSLTK